MPTNGDDTLFFQGTLGQLTLTMVNPYSGRQIEIDEEKNINTGIYDGLAGIDTLQMTRHSDALFLTDNVGMQLVRNVEIVRAGRGSDIVNLADADIELGYITISGGNGDDILWGNVGDDVIYGDRGDDIIDGGPGDDRLYGGRGDDDITGGEGSDLLSGGKGDDILFYNGDEIWPNRFVAWNVGSPDEIIDGAIVTVNPRNRSHDGFDGGKGEDTLYMTDEGDGLFLDDRYSDNPFGENTARIIDVETIVAGGGNDIVDLTSMQFSYGDVTIYGGDGDDVLWSNAGDDTLYGGAGNDHLDGGSGDDVLVVGEGKDRIYGRSGSDDIVYDVLDNALDTVFGFETGKGGDALNLSDVLEGYDSKHSDISDFVRFTDAGKNSIMSVDANGLKGGESFINIAKINDAAGLDENTLLAEGNLIVV